MLGKTGLKVRRKMIIKIWVDDVRPAPEGYYW